jgi:alpha-ketoglutarate-dependent taurine dioxygenase
VPEAAPSPKAPEPTVGQPSSETLEAESMNECVNRLRALQSRFESLPKWKPLDRSKPKDKDAEDKQRRENADREVLNKTALQDYFQVLWDLLVLNESWSEAREEQLDNAKLVGGVLQSTKPPSSREDENIEVLEAWKQVAEIAETWLASFAEKASLSDAQLKAMGELFADAKLKSTPPAELGNQKKLARMFPPIKGPEDWQREVKSATQRLEDVPKKSKKPAGEK